MGVANNSENVVTVNSNLLTTERFNYSVGVVDGLLNGHKRVLSAEHLKIVALERLCIGRAILTEPAKTEARAALYLARKLYCCGTDGRVEVNRVRLAINGFSLERVVGNNQKFITCACNKV